MILRKFSRSVALPVLPRKSTFHQRTIVPHTACYPTLYIKTLNLHITQFLQLSKFKIVLCDILKCVLGVLGTGGVPAVKSMCGICVEWATFQCGIGETCTTNLWNFMRGIGRGPAWIRRLSSPFLNDSFKASGVSPNTHSISLSSNMPRNASATSSSKCASSSTGTVSVLVLAH